MTTVYVVTSGVYSDYQIDAMFSTMEKAEQYIVRRKEIASRSRWGGGYDSNGIDEWELDGVKEEWLRGEDES